MKHSITILTLLITVVAQAQTIDKAYTTFKNNAVLKNATTALYVVDCATKQTLFEHNKELSVTPASTLKLLTTISALELLGSNYEIKTKLVFDSISHTLHLYPNYDPTWASEYVAKDAFANALTTVIKNKKWNVTTLNVHTNTQDLQPTNTNWLWGDMGNYFGASPQSINWKDNKLTTYFNTTAAGDSAELVKYAPKIDKLNITHTVLASTKSGDNTIAYSAPNSYNVLIEGELPEHKNNYEVEISNPLVSNLFAQEMKQLLGIKTINFNNNKPMETPTNTAFITSPKLSELVQKTNLHSLNLYAECLLKQLAIQQKWGAKNTTILNELLNYWKIKLPTQAQGMDLQDACGLSPMNKVTAQFQTQLLLHAHNANYYAALDNSLPVMAQSGSLKNMCKGTVAEGRISAKTGYIHGVRAYSGYVKTLSNKTLAFSFVVNNFTCSPAQVKQLMEQVFVSMVMQ
ncbi:MAG: D-alanyl-D-alanine carboxypeptidase/D-alanyl-D-alanine-endopeptidase [Bacteroidia bacterium]